MKFQVFFLSKYKICNRAIEFLIFTFSSRFSVLISAIVLFNYFPIKLIVTTI
jgi:hypothetical protein